MRVLAQIFMVFVITGHNTNPWADKNGTLSPVATLCMLRSAWLLAFAEWGLGVTLGLRVTLRFTFCALPPLPLSLGSH